MDEPLDKNIASPYSTGGGGHSFEQKVGAYYLSTLLLRTVPRGQSTGVTQEVKFQRLFEGQPLDDLIIVTELPNGKAQLALQIKRDLSFGENDLFNEVVNACWQTFKSSSFQFGRDRFGIIVGIYNKDIAEHYETALTWARHSSTAEDYFNRISQKKLSSETQRSFVNLIKSKLDVYNGSPISKNELWHFLSSLVILHFDLQSDTSRDYFYITTMLNTVLLQEKNITPSNLFLKLADCASVSNRTAGSFDILSLRQNLQDFFLLPSLDCKEDLKHLKEHADYILNSIAVDINGLELNRNNYLDDIEESNKDISFIEIVGPPGSGKSAILKNLVRQQQNHGQVLVLAGNRITGKGWDDFANSHGLTRSLREILISLSGTPHPCIFIDGIDRVISEDAQLVINDLLRVIVNVQLSQNNSRNWKIVVTSVEENLPEVYLWIDHRLIKNHKRITISELSTEELSTIAENRPYLQPLILIEELEPIIKNLFLLNLIDKYQLITLTNKNAEPITQTEIGVSIIWWNSVVGKTGTLGIARKTALLELGERIIKSKSNRVSCNGIDGNALKSLEVDRIIVREENRELYRFSHDILENWVLYHVLEQNQYNLVPYIKEKGQPLGIFRAVQLLGCFLLETNDLTSWEKLIKEIEQNKELAPKWRQAFLTSVLISTKIEELLNKIEPFLLINEGERLRDLLTILRTIEINPDPIWIETLLNNSQTADEPLERITEFLWLNPIPRWKIWYQVVNWLIKKVNVLPPNIRFEAIKIFKLWQKKTPYGSDFRKEIAEIAFIWLEELEEQKLQEEEERKLRLEAWRNRDKTEEEKKSEEKAKSYLLKMGWKGYTNDTTKTQE